jgi:hypothetical protein
MEAGLEYYKVATLADIEKIEKVPFNERIKFSNTYDMIKQGASINPDAPAISLLLSGDPPDPDRQSIQTSTPLGRHQARFRDGSQIPRESRRFRGCHGDGG